MGESFVFLTPQNEPGLAWMERPIVASRVNRPVALGGTVIAAADLPTLDLAILTSDKALYAANQEPVHVLAYDPIFPDKKSATLYKDSMLVREVAVEPDGLGAAHLVLTGLDAGQYQLFWKNTQVAFQVATYKLAPLVASVAHQEARGAALHLTLELTSYGSPFEGAVRVTLPERSAEGMCRQGKLDLSVPLSGSKTIVLELQSLDDPSLTASLPLVATAPSERKESVLARLGHRLTATLLPSAGSRPVRGLFLSQGEPEDSPLKLESLDGRRLRLTATRTLDCLRAVVVDPTSTAPYRPEEPSARARLASLLVAEGRREAALAVLAEAECCHELHLRGSLQPDAELARRDLLASLSCGPPGELAAPGLERLLHPIRETTVQRLEAGQCLELELPAPLAVVCLGAFLDGSPWETRAILPVATPELVRVTLPQNVVPHQPCELVLEGPAQAAYVVLKDARLLTTSTPSSALAACLKLYPRQRGTPARPTPPPASRPMVVASPAWSEEAGRALVAEQTITERQLARAIELSERTGSSVGSALLALGFVSAHDLCEVISRQIGAPFVRLEPGSLDPELTRAIPEHLAHRYIVVPIGQNDNRLTLAMADPLNVIAVDDIRLITGFEIDPVLAAESDIRAALESAFGVTDLVEVEETVKDISAQDFGSIDADEVIVMDKLRSDFGEAPARRPATNLEKSPQTVFAGLVPVPGRLEVVPGTQELVLEVLGLGPLDWSFETARLQPRKSPHVELEVPAFVHSPDVAMGRVAVVAGQGELVLTHDGQEVLRQAVESGQQVAFPVFPGGYEASLGSDRARAEVMEPGNFRRQVRVIRWLQPGETLEPPEGLLHYRVLRNLSGTLGQLVRATAEYSHACCEQTSTIMLSAAALYGLSGSDPGQRSWAEGVLRAGVERISTMHLPGRGLKIYPNYPDIPDTYWGPIAALNLRSLELVEGLSHITRRAVAIGEDAARAYGLQWPPDPPRNAHESYLAARLGRPAPLCRVESEGAVQRRTEQAWTAALLLRQGEDTGQAIALANQVLSAIQAEGRLYSTLDSLAAMALVQELTHRTASGRLEVGGKLVLLEEAEGLTGPCRVLDGEVMAELTLLRRETWAEGQPGLLKAWLEEEQLGAGDRVDLRWRLPNGYETGDLLWVCLPDALSRLVGGGQVKLFSVDLEGNAQGRLELVATGPTPAGPQHFQVCLRNMYQEERMGPSELLSVEVAPPVRTQGARGPVNLLPPGQLESWARNDQALELARSLLGRLTTGQLELCSGREQGWLRWSESSEARPGQECLQAGAALMGLAGLELRTDRFQDGELEHEGRRYSLLVLPVDTGLRARLEAL